MTASSPLTGGVAVDAPAVLGDPAEPGTATRTLRLGTRRSALATTQSSWVAEQLQGFVDAHPEFETPVERLATWLARLDDPED